MASAATEGEKGSPVVVGLLVVGNIIILVRGRIMGAGECGGKGGSPRPEVGLRPQVCVLQALVSDAKEDPSYLSLQREQPVL